MTIVSGTGAGASIGEIAEVVCDDAPVGSVLGCIGTASMMFEPSLTYCDCPVCLGCTGPAATDEVYYVGSVKGGDCSVHSDTFDTSKVSGDLAATVVMVIVMVLAAVESVCTSLTICMAADEMACENS